MGNKFCSEFEFIAIHRISGEPVMKIDEFEYLRSPKKFKFKFYSKLSFIKIILCCYLDYNCKCLESNKNILKSVIFFV